jgi:hypothetical protein
MKKDDTGKTIEGVIGMKDVSERKNVRKYDTMMVQP